MNRGIPAVAHLIKDLAFPRLWCSPQLRLRFDPWPGNFHRPRCSQKETKNNE